MSVIEKQKKERFKQVAIRLESSLADQLTEYAEWLESSKSYVITQALRLVIGRDKDFAAYCASKLEASADSSAEKRRTSRVAVPA